MKIKPAREFVLLKVKEKDPNKILIVVPEGSYDDEVSLIGEIIEVGEHSSYKKGQLVLFKKHLFDEVVLEDKKVLLLGKEENITATVEL